MRRVAVFVMLHCGRRCPLTCIRTRLNARASSLINTIWHVLTDETGAFHKVAHTAHGAQSATAQPRSIIYQPDVDDTVRQRWQQRCVQGCPSEREAPLTVRGCERAQRQGGTFTLWDTPGFKVFNEAELRVMEEYVETGIRERADVLGLVRGMDAGYPGDPACAVDHFVWVFGMKRLGAAVPEAEGARARSPARPRTAGGPQNATVSVTKKGLEFTKQGRELFWQFYSYACSRSGTAPTVVLTHVDQFTAAEVGEAKTLIQALTQVDVHDILTVTCYRSEYCPPPARPDTEFAAIHIMHTALARADTYRAPRRDHTVQRLSRAFSEMAHRFRVLVWHVQRAKYVCVCMILVVFVLAVFVVLKLANRHGQGDVVHMPAPPATFDVASP